MKECSNHNGTTITLLADSRAGVSSEDSDSRGDF